MADDRPLSARSRVAGVTIPLFSLHSASSWGIGEIGDLPEFARWMAEVGIGLIQILPLGEISAAETSPYSALTAFGIDPMYISIADLPDLPESVVHDALGGDSGVAILDRARSAERIDYGSVRLAKSRALRFGFDRFRTLELPSGSQRAQDFEAFCDHQRHWLADYALFRAMKDRHGGVAWWEWPKPLRDRDGTALHHARLELAIEIQYFQYLQWVAHTQWLDARAKLHERRVEIMGDLPFMVGRDSADVWANQGEFRHDMNVGAPADQFNEEGQDWGLPPYRWDAMRANDFAWLRRRSRYAGSLYDRFRIDHLVGFYRTFVRPMKVRDENGRMVKGVYDPADERAQLAHGERVITAMADAARENGAELLAEDLGIVPDWVRKSLTRMGVLGYKVLIWEKDGAVFRDPAKYPELSLACLGTHDSDPIATWWETRDAAELDAVKAIPSWADRAKDFGARFTPTVHRALLELILSAPSRLVLLMIHDMLATHERINTPATTGSHNWTLRLAAPPAELKSEAAIHAAMEAVRHAIAVAKRTV